MIEDTQMNPKGESLPDIDVIFHAALEIVDQDDRRTYLDAACGADLDLRRRVESLLDADLLADDFFTTAMAVANQEREAVALTSAVETPGTRIDRYKLLQQIGEGGFGTVWMAEQTEPVKRRVALKIIKLGMDTREVIARFEAERQALAMMEHANIARVLDAGATESGRPFFVMELVKGIAITEFCDERRLNTKQRLKLFIEVCSAINHAHQKGIIHRDIKPSNVLVTLHGDRPVPKVIDFGIAKATQQDLTDKTLFTRFEQFIGTPVYMSPEQAALSGLDIDTRSDIYALGVLLYELLTGKPPFDMKSLVSAGYDEMRRIIREDEPPRPSVRLGTVAGDERTTLARTRHVEPEKLNRLVRRELDWIVMKAIEKDRARRYETADAFAQDIAHFLADEPVTAVAPSATYKLRKFVSRNRTVFAVAATITLLLIGGIWLSTTQWRRAVIGEEAERKAAIAAKQSADQATVSAESLRRTAYNGDMGSAWQAISEGNFGRARTLLDRHRPVGEQVDIRGYEWRFLWGRSRSQEKKVLGRYEGSWGGLAVSPDGGMVASVEGENIVLRSLPGGEEMTTLLDVLSPLVGFSPDGHPGPLVRFSPDGRYLLVQDGGGIRRWKTDGWEEQERLAEIGAPFAFASDANVLVGWSAGNFLSVWNTETWAPINEELPGTVKMDHFLRQSIAVSADGRRAYLGDDHGVIRSWDISEGRELERLDTLIDNTIPCLAISSEGVLAAGHWSGLVTLWDAKSHELIASLDDHLAWVSTVAFSTDGSVLASASADRPVALYHLEDGRTPTFWKDLVGHKGEVWAMALSPDNHSMITGSNNDETLRLWDIRDEASGLRSNQVSIPLEFSESGEVVVGWSETEKRFVTLNIETGKVSALPEMAVAEGVTIGDPLWRRDSIDPANNWLAQRKLVAETAPGGVDIKNLSTGELVEHLSDPMKARRFCTFSEDGRLFATATKENGVRVYRTDDWSWKQLIPDFRGDAGLRFSPDGGKLVVLAEAEGWLIDLGSGKVDMDLLWDVSPDNDIAMAKAFSSDGSLLAVGTPDNRIHLWNLQTKKFFIVMDGHVAGIRGLCFSPDGRTLVSCGDKRVKLWNVELGQELFTLHLAKAETARPIFSPDGNCLVTSTSEPGLHFWIAPSWEEISEEELQYPSHEKPSPQGKPNEFNHEN